MDFAARCSSSASINRRNWSQKNKRKGSCTITLTSYVYTHNQRRARSQYHHAAGGRPPTRANLSQQLPKKHDRLVLVFCGKSTQSQLLHEMIDKSASSWIMHPRAHNLAFRTPNLHLPPNQERRRRPPYSPILSLIENASSAFKAAQKWTFEESRPLLLNMTYDGRMASL